MEWFISVDLPNNELNSKLINTQHTCLTYVKKSPLPPGREELTQTSLNQFYIMASKLFAEDVDRSCMSEQFSPDRSSHLTSCHTCSHFTLDSQVFVFGHD